MNATIDVSHNILHQFASALQIEVRENSLLIDAELGKGQIRLTLLPNQIEFYHFDVQLKQPYEIHSFNPDTSDWFLLHINLSDHGIQKTVNNEAINIQKYLPSGILLYSPNTAVHSVSPPDKAFSVVLLRFNRALLELYNTGVLFFLNATNAAIIYEELDYRSEELLHSCIQNSDNLLLIHSCVLEFLNSFFLKLKHRERESSYERLHPDDLKGLFMARAHLRDPLSRSIPSIDDLSKIAGMGTTKFKTTFKQVFGTSPIQYHLRIKMEYAKDQLTKKRTTPSEISYQLGYSHPSKFTTAFKRQFGILPSMI